MPEAYPVKWATPWSEKAGPAITDSARMFMAARDAERARRVAAVDAGWAVLVQQLPEMHRAGSVELDADGRISRIVEGDLGGAPGIASTNLFLLDTRIFSCPLVPKQPGSLEYGLPQTIVQASASLGVPFEPVFTERWIQINSPADLVRATELVKAGTYA